MIIFFSIQVPWKPVYKLGDWGLYLGLIFSIISCFLVQNIDNFGQISYFCRILNDFWSKSHYFQSILNRFRSRYEIKMFGAKKVEKLLDIISAVLEKNRKSHLIIGHGGSRAFPTYTFWDQNLTWSATKVEKMNEIFGMGWSQEHLRHLLRSKSNLIIVQKS